MKVVVMIPMWKRLILTNYVFNYYNKLRSALLPDIELILIAVGSESGISKEIAEHNGFDYVEYSNMPLNWKHNAGSERARIYNPDKFFVVNSDDIISANYFKFAAASSELAIGLLDIYFLNFKKKKLGYWKGYQIDRRRGETIGPGRCFDRKVLEKCGWQLWSQEQELIRSMDGACRDRLRTFNIEIKGYRMADVGCFAMDIKTDVGIGLWNKFRYEKIIEGDRLVEMLKKEKVADILNLPILLEDEK